MHTSSIDTASELYLSETQSTEPLKKGSARFSSDYLLCNEILLDEEELDIVQADSAPIHLTLFIVRMLNVVGDLAASELKTNSVC